MSGEAQLGSTVAYPVDVLADDLAGFESDQANQGELLCRP
jgi:hypothetical protein